ncbi:putative RWD domain-containing protein [Septoria linicola]|nr:putative RWD domain-containing protein [Septoria linicola]
MGREEQQEEREVLDSIFPDEIHDISDTEFRISIPLDTPQSQHDTLARNDGDDDDDEQVEDDRVVIILNVRYPEAYPDVAPILDITQPPNAPKHEHLDIQEDKQRLLDALEPEMEASLGMQMVFTIHATLKEAAEQLIAERYNAIIALQDAERARLEAEENKRFEGEKVTRERFLEWRDRFQKEMAEEAERKRLEQEAEEKKKRGGKELKDVMTGRQLWEQGLAGKNADDEDEGEDAITDGMRQVKVGG